MNPKPYINTKQPDKKGRLTVYIMVHIDYKSLKFKTGVFCLPENWDEKNLRVRGNSKSVKDDNLIIEECLARLNDIEVRYRLQHVQLTPELLQNEYKNPARRIDFYAFFEEALKEKKSELAPGTYRRHKSVVHVIKTQYKKTLSFSEITPELLVNIQRWFKTKLGNDTNTIHGKMRVLRAYLNIAVRKGIIKESPFRGLKLKKSSVNRVYLTNHELITLWELYKSGKLTPDKNKVLRHFLFMCFTGIRISDLKALTPANIAADMLIFAAQKTKRVKENLIRIPLNKYSKQLINDEKSTTGRLFKTISDQRMNVYIKKIAIDAGIGKSISNHSGRHTFATLWLDKTNDLAQLQALLGHSSITETMVYVHITEAGLKKQMQNFEKGLANQKPVIKKGVTTKKGPASAEPS